VLYRWQGGCGIQIAAKPGQSNHESGLAIDVAYYDYWRSALQNNGWRWYGSGDLVHYDYVAGGSDLRSANLKAFQRLWNRYTGNHVSGRAHALTLQTNVLQRSFFVSCRITDR
jgi:hypothetical protein